jgi:YbbR domain-containing protein
MNTFERRKLVLFISCLSLAVLAWLIFSLSNSYIYKVQTQVHYINSPEKKAFHPLQSDTVALQVEGTGWQLLFSKMRISPDSVSVDLGKLNVKNYITFSEQLRAINYQLASNQRVISVTPDTLYFDFSTRKTKRVPVKLAYNFQYSKSHNASGPVQLTPSYVMVSGPPEDLALINYWATDSLKLTDIESDISAKVFLKKNQKSNIIVYPTLVIVKVPVDEFTEKNLEVPLKVLNNSGYDIKLLPEKVKITFLTALRNYSKTDRGSIEATIDMNYWQNEGYKQLPVKLSRFPSFCKLVSIEPQIVDFIVK